ncbi:MAG: RsmG family class I SAM-dependent methyltransferase [Leptospirales bacterium]
MNESIDNSACFSDHFPPEILSRLDLYVDLLMEWNQSIRLAGYRSRSDIFRHLVVEPVLASMYFGLEKTLIPMIDFGSGNGSPGIVFALLNPDRRIYLVERKEKKKSFLNYLVGRFNLPFVRVSGDLMEAMSLEDAPVDLWMKGISMESLRDAFPPSVQTKDLAVHVFKFGSLDQIADCQEIQLHVINSEDFQIHPALLVQVSQCRWSIRKT